MAIIKSTADFPSVGTTTSTLKVFDAGCGKLMVYFSGVSGAAIAGDNIRKSAKREIATRDAFIVCPYARERETRAETIHCQIRNAKTYTRSIAPRCDTTYGSGRNAP